MKWMNKKNLKWRRKAGGKSKGKSEERPAVVAPKALRNPTTRHYLSHAELAKNKRADPRPVPKYVATAHPPKPYKKGDRTAAVCGRSWIDGESRRSRALRDCGYEPQRQRSAQDGESRDDTSVSDTSSSFATRDSNDRPDHAVPPMRDRVLKGISQGISKMVDGDKPSSASYTRSTTSSFETKNSEYKNSQYKVLKGISQGISKMVDGDKPSSGSYTRSTTSSFETKESEYKNSYSCRFFINKDREQSEEASLEENSREDDDADEFKNSQYTLNSGYSCRFFLNKDREQREEAILEENSREDDEADLDEFVGCDCVNPLNILVSDLVSHAGIKSLSDYNSFSFYEGGRASRMCSGCDDSEVDDDDAWIKNGEEWTHKEETDRAVDKMRAEPELEELQNAMKYANIMKDNSLRANDEPKELDFNQSSVGDAVSRQCSSRADSLGFPPRSLTLSSNNLGSSSDVIKTECVSRAENIDLPARSLTLSSNHLGKSSDVVKTDFTSRAEIIDLPARSLALSSNYLGTSNDLDLGSHSDASLESLRSISSPAERKARLSVDLCPNENNIQVEDVGLSSRSPSVLPVSQSPSVSTTQPGENKDKELMTQPNHPFDGNSNHPLTTNASNLMRSASSAKSTMVDSERRWNTMNQNTLQSNGRWPHAFREDGFIQPPFTSSRTAYF
ncbi:hypothetical protein ACHAWF_003978 [Thalassiosira exigua]